MNQNGKCKHTHVHYSHSEREWFSCYTDIYTVQDETWTDLDGPLWIQYDLFRKNKLPGSKKVNLAKFMLPAIYTGAISNVGSSLQCYTGNTTVMKTPSRLADNKTVSK